MTDPAAIAKQYGGHQTWTYKQSGWDTIKHTAWDSKTRWGICAALSAYWIAKHANGGSLAKDLVDDKLGNLNHPLIKECAALQKSSLSGGSNNQVAHIERWLKWQDVFRVKKSWGRSTQGFDGTPTIDAHSARQTFRSPDFKTKDPDIANKIVSKGLQNLRNHYGYLHFEGTAMKFSAGHVTACWVGNNIKTGAGDAVFFDPNYGEFYFDNKVQFFSFFRPFYHATYITKTMNFSQGYLLLPFSKDAFCE